MIDPERIKRIAVEKLGVRGQKQELSQQAIAVIEAIARELNEQLGGAKPAKPTESLKKQLTDEWCAAYQFTKGRKYAFEGAKDGKAADRLLALGLPVGEIIALAAQAWNHPDWFNCKQAATLSGFACRYNDIREELENPPLPKPSGGYRRPDRVINPSNAAGHVL